MALVCHAFVASAMEHRQAEPPRKHVRAHKTLLLHAFAAVLQARSHMVFAAKAWQPKVDSTAISFVDQVTWSQLSRHVLFRQRTSFDNLKSNLPAWPCWPGDSAPKLKRNQLGRNQLRSRPGVTWPTWPIFHLFRGALFRRRSGAAGLPSAQFRSVGWRRENRNRLL